MAKGKALRHLLLSALMAGASLQAADTVADWFKEGTFSGNVKYYFIETKKENPGR